MCIFKQIPRYYSNKVSCNNSELKLLCLVVMGIKIDSFFRACRKILEEGYPKILRMIAKENVYYIGYRLNVKTEKMKNKWSICSYVSNSM